MADADLKLKTLQKFKYNKNSKKHLISKDVFK